MSFVSSPRTPASPPSADGTPEGRKGSISIIVTLMFLSFTILGMGMLLLSQVHLKAGAGRKNSALLDYAAENGIKRALEDIDGALTSRTSLIEPTPGRMSELRSDALLGGTKIVEELFGWPLPRLIRETWEDMNWESVTACDPERTEDREEFLSVGYRVPDRFRRQAREFQAEAGLPVRRFPERFSRKAAPPLHSPFIE